MSEKILNAVVKIVLPTFFSLACATAGSLAAYCIEMKLRENAIKKAQKEKATAEGKN